MIDLGVKFAHGACIFVTAASCRGKAALAPLPPWAAVALEVGRSNPCHPARVKSTSSH